MGFLYANQEQMEQSLQDWQKELRLMDWEISIAIKPAHKMFSQNVQASIEWQLAEKTAMIHILHPDDYPDGLVRDQDQEISLVHELIHLHYAPFEETEDGTLAHDMMELSIDTISHTLVRLKREGAKAHDAVRSAAHV